MKRTALALAATFLLVLPAAAGTAPNVTSATSLADLPTPLPFPFDDAADANKDVDAALTQAKAEHKLVFIDLGGNWCADCRVLSGIMDLPEVKPFIDAHYVVVNVDVGRFNRNLQIPARWNSVEALKTGGAPCVLVVDPQSGKLLDQARVSALEEARHMTPQSIVDWIAQWVR